MSVEDSAQMILLAGVFGVLVVILVVLGSISRSLVRMERRMSQQQEVAKPSLGAVAVTGESLRKTAQKQDFMTFLSEDAQRRQLPKREQFTAYRKWRKERGLNWPRVTGDEAPM